MWKPRIETWEGCGKLWNRSDGTHFNVAMATGSVPVSCLFNMKYYHLRLNKAKYLVLLRRMPVPPSLGLLFNIFTVYFAPCSYKWYCYIARLSLNKVSTAIVWFLITCPWSNSNVSSCCPQAVRTLGKTKLTVSLGTIHKVYNIWF